MNEETFYQLGFHLLLGGILGYALGSIQFWLTNRRKSNHVKTEA